MTRTEIGLCVSASANDDDGIKWSIRLYSNPRFLLSKGTRYQWRRSFYLCTTGTSSRVRNIREECSTASCIWVASFMDLHSDGGENKQSTAAVQMAALFQEEVKNKYGVRCQRHFAKLIIMCCFFGRLVIIVFLKLFRCHLTSSFYQVISFSMDWNSLVLGCLCFFFFFLHFF